MKKSILFLMTGLVLLIANIVLLSLSITSGVMPGLVDYLLLGVTGIYCGLMFLVGFWMIYGDV